MCSNKPSGFVKRLPLHNSNARSACCLSAVDTDVFAIEFFDQDSFGFTVLISLRRKARAQRPKQDVVRWKYNDGHDSAFYDALCDNV